MVDLTAGLAVEEVAGILNIVLGGQTVWCDGGPYDAYWLQRLYKAAAKTPEVRLRDWHLFLKSLGNAERERALAWLDRVPQRHRAKTDAQHLLQALGFAIGAEPALEDLPTTSLLLENRVSATGGKANE